jgi:hypothetical protein
LNDEQREALDELLQGLLALEPEERRRVADDLITHLKEMIEDKGPVN